MVDRRQHPMEIQEDDIVGCPTRVVDSFSFLSFVEICSNRETEI